MFVFILLICLFIAGASQPRIRKGGGGIIFPPPPHGSTAGLEGRPEAEGGRLPAHRLAHERTRPTGPPAGPRVPCAAHGPGAHTQGSGDARAWGGDWVWERPEGQLLLHRSLRAASKGEKPAGLGQSRSSEGGDPK